MSPRHDWTPEREALLSEKAALHWSASQIAAELGGVSRNAVIGKAERMGVTLDGRSGYGPKTYEPARPRGSGRAPPPPKPEPEPEPTAEEIVKGAMPFAERSAFQCAWILQGATWGSDDALCCGRKVATGIKQPYCAHHHRIGTQDVTPGLRLPALTKARPLGRWSGRG